MPYMETKVYFDGSHYIAIPHTERPRKPRRKPQEVLITVKKKIEKELPKESGAKQTEAAPELTAEAADLNCERTLFNYSQIDSAIAKKAVEDSKRKQNERKITRKGLFNELYAEYLNVPKKDRKEKITEAMRPYFKNEMALNSFINNNFERKLRNLICRRVRLSRKANLQSFNYFVTFTYDSKLHTEESFKKRLRNTLSIFSSRKGWKYIGVWERSPEKRRLHFHGIFYIPKNTMPGLLFERNDYNFNTHRRQITVQNTYFNERFGRSDFEQIKDGNRLGDAMAYLMKYIEKTGEKIVYSKGLYQYFISDILDEDVITVMDEKYESSKLLLFDNFKCWDMGEYKGEVSDKTIAALRKCN